MTLGEKQKALMRGLMGTPETSRAMDYFKAVREQRTYGRLFERLQLPPASLRELRRLRSEKKTPQRDAAISALLGHENFKVYSLYEENITFWNLHRAAIDDRLGDVGVPPLTSEQAWAWGNNISPYGKRSARIARRVAP